MNKILFHIGHIPVYSYGVMMVVGYIFSFLCIVIYGKKKGFNFEKSFKLVTIILIFGIFGARILYVILNWNNYHKDILAILNTSSGGLSWHGGIIGGIIAILFFTKSEKHSFLDVADISMLAGIMGLAFGRIGCFLNGCCYGKPSSLPWAISMNGIDLTPRHPTQLYESILDFIVFIILLITWKNRKFKGQVFCLFMILYSGVRFLVEFFRENQNFENIFYGLNLAQMASILIIIMGTGIYVTLMKNRGEEPFAPAK